MNIRKATDKDIKNIHQIYLQAFADEEAELVSGVAIELLRQSNKQNNLNFVAIEDQKIIGHIALSPVSIGSGCAGHILAPLAVDPRFQKQGVGSQLVKHSLSILKNRQTNIVFVYGDPKYYSRFGFSVKAANNYPPPYSLEYEQGWQAVIFQKCRAESSQKLIFVPALQNPALW